MHILRRINVVRDFIFMDSVELRGTRNKRKLQNEDFLFIVVFEPTELPQRHWLMKYPHDQLYFP